MQRYLAVILLVIVGYAVYQDRKIENISHEVNNLREDIGVIKDAILEQRGGSVKHNAKEFDCLVRNIYYEAGIEDDLGKYAVAQVTLNRRQLGRWGKDLCKVVYARAQFSWTSVKKRAWETPKDKNWQRSVEIAKNVLIKGYHVKPLKKSLFYHADYVAPKWRDDDKRIMQIGRHIFYTQARGTTYKL